MLLDKQSTGTKMCKQID